MRWPKLRSTIVFHAARWKKVAVLLAWTPAARPARAGLAPPDPALVAEANDYEENHLKLLDELAKTERDPKLEKLVGCHQRRDCHAVIVRLTRATFGGQCFADRRRGAAEEEGEFEAAAA